MTLALLCLLFFSMLPADSTEIPLGMVDDAVDDMYFGCKERMPKKLKDKYFGKEITGKFGEAWEADKKSITQDTVLTDDEKKAVSVYVQGKDQWYSKLNDRVRSGRADYGTDNFTFHYFHFWLTSAIQSLNKDAKCYNSYHRSNITFIGNDSQTFRFGAFTSSSLITKLSHFGRETCFKIKTCLGGSLGNHSKLPHEQEVLIPPYEMFTISKKIKDRFVEGLEDCKQVYVLETAGNHSNLNCNLFQEK